MSMMKEIFAHMINDRLADFPAEHRSNDYDEEEFKSQFDYHLLKDPGGLSLHILVTSDNDILCSGTLSAIKEYIKMKDIPFSKVYNFHNYMND